MDRSTGQPGYTLPRDEIAGLVTARRVGECQQDKSEPGRLQFETEQLERLKTARNQKVIGIRTSPERLRDKRDSRG